MWDGMLCLTAWKVISQIGLLWWKYTKKTVLKLIQGFTRSCQTFLYKELSKQISEAFTVLKKLEEPKYLNLDLKKILASFSKWSKH